MVVVDGVTPIQEQALEYSFSSVHALAYDGMHVGSQSRLAGPPIVEVAVTVVGGGVADASKKLDC